MYSEKFNTIFVHVPKTGGQSIEHVFLNEHGLTWETRAPLLLRKKAEGERGPSRLAHLFAPEYVRFGFVAEEDFAACFKFAVVRNPYDRAVSAYRYRMAGPAANPAGSFREHVLSLKSDGAHRHDELQVNYVFGGTGTLLVDEILRFENLAAEFVKVSQQVFGRMIALPHENKSVSQMPAEAHDPELRRILYRHYERDFDTFKYPSGF